MTSYTFASQAQPDFFAVRRGCPRPCRALPRRGPPCPATAGATPPRSTGSAVPMVSRSLARGG